jgi:hypothetical protein
VLLDSPSSQPTLEEGDVVSELIYK